MDAGLISGRDKLKQRITTLQLCWRRPRLSIVQDRPCIQSVLRGTLHGRVVGTLRWLLDTPTVFRHRRVTATGLNPLSQLQ